MMEKSSFWSLINHKNFISSENLTDDISLVKFQNTSAYCNTSQNHIALVQYGRFIMLQSLIKLLEVLEFEVVSSNTDGIITASSSVFSNCHSQPIFLFDSWLRKNIDESAIREPIFYTSIVLRSYFKMLCKASTCIIPQKRAI